MALYESKNEVDEDDEPDGTTTVGQDILVQEFTFMLKPPRNDDEVSETTNKDSDDKNSSGLPTTKFYVEVFATSNSNIAIGEEMSLLTNRLLHFHYTNKEIKEEASHPGQVALSKDTPEQELNLHYNCSALEQFGNGRYHDDVLVHVDEILNGTKNRLLDFQFKVVCKPSKLYQPDLNMPILFLIAIGIIYVAFHTPELRMVLEMSE